MFVSKFIDMPAFALFVRDGEPILVTAPDWDYRRPEWFGAAVCDDALAVAGRARAGVWPNGVKASDSLDEHFSARFRGLLGAIDGENNHGRLSDETCCVLSRCAKNVSLRFRAQFWNVFGEPAVWAVNQPIMEFANQLDSYHVGRDVTNTAWLAIGQRVVRLARAATLALML